MIKNTVLNPYLAVPASLLGLLVLVVALTPQTTVAIFTDPLLHSRHDVGAGPQRIEARLGSPEQSNLTAPILPADVIWEMLQQVDGDRALTELRQLTGEAPLCVDSGCYTITHRLTGSDGLARAMEYVHEELAALGYAVEFHDWSRSGYADRNLIARKTGVLTPSEEIYLVAHLDGAKMSAGRYPAADDNASSVVNGLELARVFSNHFFGRTIVLFFSTGEEQGTLGVREYLAQLPPGDLSAIKFVINRDVTGYDANGDRVMELLHGGHPPSQALAEVMSATIDAYQLDLDQRVIVGCP